jgi:hypothetical protein
MKKSSKQKGSNFEKKCQDTINSGAMAFDKGDLKTAEFVIECKYTEKKGFKITTDILDKIWNCALDANKLPKLIIGIKNENITYTVICDIKKEVK